MTAMTARTMTASNVLRRAAVTGFNKTVWKPVTMAMKTKRTAV
jgi:hypothetical protein